MKINNVLIVALGVLALSSCGSIKKDLGIARNSPDEFTVVKQAPLSVPPEYNLVPPVDREDMVEKLQSRSPSEQARRAVLGQTNTSEDKSESDEVFMGKLKTDDAQADIRKLIEEDNGYLYIQNQSMIEKLTSDDEETIVYEKFEGSTVDAEKEAKRIKENKESGKAINEGDVPVIKKKTSTLDKIF